MEDGDEPFVVHHVETSLVPNWVARPQRRAVALDGDRLQLTAPALDVGGRTAVPVLTWRLGAAPSSSAAAGPRGIVTGHDERGHQRHKSVIE